MSQSVVDTAEPIHKKPGSRMREATERKILDAATKVFSERGFASATIAEMVESSGLARGTFYLYFSDKRAVFDALVAQVTDDLFNVATPPGTGSYRERIHEATNAYVKVFAQHAGIISCIFEVATCDKDINQLQNGYREKFRQRIESHIERRIRSGQFRQIDPQAASYCLCAMVEGSTYEWVCANYKPWSKSKQGVQRLVETLTDIWCHYVELPGDGSMTRNSSI